MQVWANFRLFWKVIIGISMWLSTEIQCATLTSSHDWRIEKSVDKGKSRQGTKINTSYSS